MGKRGWIGISIKILESASTPKNKTRLMFESNLSFERFNACIDDFLQKGLLEEIDVDGIAYVISDRGKTLLAALRSTEKLFSQVPAKVEPTIVNMCV